MDGDWLSDERRAARLARKAFGTHVVGRRKRLFGHALGTANVIAIDKMAIHGLQTFRDITCDDKRGEKSPLSERRKLFRRILVDIAFLQNESGKERQREVTSNPSFIVSFAPAHLEPALRFHWWGCRKAKTSSAIIRYKTPHQYLQAASYSRSYNIFCLCARICPRHQHLTPKPHFDNHLARKDSKKWRNPGVFSSAKNLLGPPAY